MNSSKSSKFIFFGCWNNINCDSEYIYRNIVLDYIKDNEPVVKQIYIAGDNWYTNKKTIKDKELKDKELKLYITEILRTGYDKLYAMEKDIYIAVGNHDIDSNISVGKKLGIAVNAVNAVNAVSAVSAVNAVNAVNASSQQSPIGSSSASNPSSNSREERIDLQKDCNINTQKYYLKQIKNGAKKFKNPTLESLRDIKDTELSEVALREQGIYIYIEDIGVCYNNDSIVIIINTNKFDNFDEGELYLEEIKKVIKEVVSSGKSGKQIFVMGHIPLFTNKKNTLSIHEINKKNPKFRVITYKLFDILTDHNIIYLCADTHNFSIMEITHDGKVLIQITAGTGGADPDLIVENLKTPIIKLFEDENDGKIYVITAYSINSYGYVSINIGISYINVCYTQVVYKQLEKKLALQETSYTSVKKITYKIKKKDSNLTYKSTIEEISYSNYGTIYDTNGICKQINNDSLGYITGKEGKLFCFKKNIKKIKKISKDKLNK